MNNVFMVIVTGVIFWLGGFAVGAGAGAMSVKESLVRRLKRFHDDDELSVQLIKELIEEA